MTADVDGDDVDGWSGPSQHVVICLLEDGALRVQVTVFGKRQAAGGDRHKLLLHSKLRD